ncbi:MAG: FAD-binding oxidoreductase, partial [Candidatus Bathyarchaeia archaeon]
MEDCDIIVVGAGVFGMAAAYHLQRNNPEKRILVLERLAQVGQANTALSAAAYRNMFSSRTNQLLADSSINFYLHVQNDLKYDINLEQIGYLWLLTEDQFSQPSVKSWLTNMERSGIEFRLYDEKELREKNPALAQDVEGDEEAQMMRLENIKHGLFGPKCGVLSPTRLTEYYRDEFIRLSQVPPRFNVEVTRLLLEPSPKLDLPGEPYIWQDAKITGVETKQGLIRADTVVVAAGCWVNQILDPVGIPSYVKVKKRQLFSIPADGPDLANFLNMRGFNELGLSPFIILPKGVYIRPVRHENAFWIGCAD